MPTPQNLGASEHSAPIFFQISTPFRLRSRWVLACCRDCMLFCDSACFRCGHV